MNFFLKKKQIIKSWAIWLAFQIATAGEFQALRDMSGAAEWVQLLVQGHALGYKLALVFFAMSLTFQAALFLRSAHFSNWLAWLLFAAAVGYLTDRLATIGLPSYLELADFFEVIVIVSALVGELSLCIWLLVKGVRKPAARTLQV